MQKFAYNPIAFFSISAHFVQRKHTHTRHLHCIFP